MFRLLRDVTDCSGQESLCRLTLVVCFCDRPGDDNEEGMDGDRGNGGDPVPRPDGEQRK